MLALRHVPFDLSDQAREKTIAGLQEWLAGLIALSLRLKQAHWNLIGPRFKSVHEQFDEVLTDVRRAVDDVAERIMTLGGTADGLPSTVAEHEHFGAFPTGRLSVEQAVWTICDDLAKTVQDGRKCIDFVATLDPISEDLIIGVVGDLEKHHWMLHSQSEQ